MCFFISFPGDTILHTEMAVEGLGGREDSRPDDGPRHRSLLRGREETEEENASRLSVGKSSLPQLVGLQILSLRGASLGERRR